jgi:hypothetical protein
MEIMKILKKVTVTGADDSIDISKLFEIQTKYPFVEFAILFSNRFSLTSGTSRFPSRQWLENMIKANEASDVKLTLSGHLCGRWVKKTLLGDFPDLDVELNIPTLTKAFSRWQINTHGEPHPVDFDKLDAILNKLDEKSQSVIFQLDDVNHIIQSCHEKGHRNISGLFDLSHGTGVLPTTWPKTLDDIYCGYAGGMSPDNVVEQIENILKVSPNKPFWIDAETKLRSEDCRYFDLNNVERFLNNTIPYVI